MGAAELITHSQALTVVRVGQVVEAVTVLDQTTTLARWTS